MTTAAISAMIACPRLLSSGLPLEPSLELPFIITAMSTVKSSAALAKPAARPGGSFLQYYNYSWACMLLQAFSHGRQVLCGNAVPAAGHSTILSQQRFVCVLQLLMKRTSLAWVAE